MSDNSKHQQVRDIYAEIMRPEVPVVERRDRLVLAALKLADSVAKGFAYTYPSSRYSRDDLKAEAALALVGASGRAVSGDCAVDDIVSYLSGAVWKALSKLREESYFIGPSAATAAKRRKRGQPTGQRNAASLIKKNGRVINV